MADSGTREERNICDLEHAAAVEISMLVLYSIWTCVEIYICVAAARVIVSMRKNNSPLLTSAQWLFYLTAFLFALIRVPLTIHGCFIGKGISYDIIWGLAFFCYGFHLLGMMFLLYARLRDTFENTTFKLSKFVRITFWCICAIFLLAGIVAFLGGHLQFGLFLLTSAFLLLLITSQYLTWSFVYKLHQINQSNEQFDVSFITFLRKYCVLSIVCVMFTTFYAFSAALITSTGYNFYWQHILSLIIVLDIFFDSFCMLLSYKAYDAYYYKFCGVCHRHCCCLICVSAKKADHAMKMHQLSVPGLVATRSVSSSPQSTSIGNNEAGIAV